MTLVIMIGILVHLLGPFISIILLKVMREKFYKYREILNPQRIYDITTIIGALICLSVIYYEIYLQLLVKDNIVITSLFSGLIGGMFPLIFWKFQKRIIIFKGRNSFNKDTLIYLPICALAEEIIWRFCLPFLLYTYLFNSTYLAIIISSVGFIILHLSVGGLKSIPYISIFTIGIVLIYCAFGLLAAILFHIVHNLIVNLFYPRKAKLKYSENPVKSQTEW